MVSGDLVKTVSPVVAPTGALIDPGTACMVLGVVRQPKPEIYLVETLETPDFEPEEFYCYANDLQPVGGDQ